MEVIIDRKRLPHEFIDLSKNFVAKISNDSSSNDKSIKLVINAELDKESVIALSHLLIDLSKGL